MTPVTMRKLPPDLVTLTEHDHLPRAPRLRVQIMTNSKGYVELNLSHRDLRIVPPETFQMVSTEVLRLAHNYIDLLPMMIAYLRLLKVLDMQHNLLVSLPETLVNCRHLAELQLTANRLTELPRTIGGLKNLRVLRLGENQFEQLPQEVGQMTSLRVLDLHGNKLWHLPISLQELRHLLRLDLNDNMFDHIPLVVTKITSLQALTMAKNRVAALPVDFDSLKSLRELNLSHNKFVSISSMLVALRRLKYLSLAGNGFKFLPPHMTYLQNLRVLHLQENSLRHVPSGLKQLCYYNVAKNHLTSFSVEGLRNLVSLTASYNHLETPPRGLYKLKSLKFLYLNNNLLTELDEDLGKLRELRVLDLSDNHLTRLPQSLYRLARLQSFNVKNNHRLTRTGRGELKKQDNTEGKRKEDVPRADKVKGSSDTKKIFLSLSGKMKFGKEAGKADRRKKTSKVGDQSLQKMNGYGPDMHTDPNTSHKHDLLDDKDKTVLEHGKMFEGRGVTLPNKSSFQKKSKKFRSELGTLKKQVAQDKPRSVRSLKDILFGRSSQQPGRSRRAKSPELERDWNPAATMRSARSLHFPLHYNMEDVEKGWSAMDRGDKTRVNTSGSHSKKINGFRVHRQQDTGHTVGAHQHEPLVEYRHFDDDDDDDSFGQRRVIHHEEPDEFGSRVDKRSKVRERKTRRPFSSEDGTYPDKETARTNHHKKEHKSIRYQLSEYPEDRWSDQWQEQDTREQNITDKHYHRDDYSAVYTKVVKSLPDSDDYVRYDPGVRGDSVHSSTYPRKRMLHQHVRTKQQQHHDQEEQHNSGQIHFFTQGSHPRFSRGETEPNYQQHFLETQWDSGSETDSSQDWAYEDNERHSFDERSSHPGSKFFRRRAEQSPDPDDTEFIDYVDPPQSQIRVVGGFMKGNQSSAVEDRRRQKPLSSQFDHILSTVDTQPPDDQQVHGNGMVQQSRGSGGHINENFIMKRNSILPNSRSLDSLLDQTFTQGPVNAHRRDASSAHRDKSQPGAGGSNEDPAEGAAHINGTDHSLLGVCNQIESLLNKDLLQPVIGFSLNGSRRQPDKTTGKNARGPRRLEQDASDDSDGAMSDSDKDVLNPDLVYGQPYTFTVTSGGGQFVSSGRPELTVTMPAHSVARTLQVTVQLLYISHKLVHRVKKFNHFVDNITEVGPIAYFRVSDPVSFNSPATITIPAPPAIKGGHLVVLTVRKDNSCIPCSSGYRSEKLSVTLNAWHFSAKVALITKAKCKYKACKSMEQLLQCVGAPHG